MIPSAHDFLRAAPEEALFWARSMPCPYAEAKLACEYGPLYVRESEPEKAWQRLSAALEIFYRLGAQKDVERTEQVLRDPDRAH